VFDGTLSFVMRLCPAAVALVFIVCVILLEMEENDDSKCVLTRCVFFNLCFVGVVFEDCVAFVIVRK